MITQRSPSGGSTSSDGHFSPPPSGSGNNIAAGVGYTLPGGNNDMNTSSSSAGTNASMHSAFRANNSYHQATLEPISSSPANGENGTRTSKNIFSSLAASFSGR
jgi:hypothetical protein